MGNRDSSLVEHVTPNAEKRIGRISVKGRYHHLPNRLEDSYDLETTALGSGYNGVVYLAKSLETGQRVAVKGFKLNGVGRVKREELASEASIFLSMDHPHIARLIDVYEGEDRLSLVMECMEGGELFDRVSVRKVFSEKDAVTAAYQMLLSVNYIHSLGVVHRDLKLENFLYERKDSDFLKLIDFGFSKIWEKNTKMELSCGTLSYVAPEVLRQSYTSQCDLWSLGVIVFILLVGYMPFSGNSEHKQIANIKQGNYLLRQERWDMVSTTALAFVKQLLRVDPQARLTASQALQHPWIKSRDEPGAHLDHSIAESLSNFAQESQFRRACMQLMAWSLTAEERGEVRDAFLELDRKRTGTITITDFKSVLEAKFHMPEDESTRVFRAMDSNVNDEVNYSEFLAAMMCSRIALHDDLLKATFRRFDQACTGFITAEDLGTVLGTEHNIDDVMKQVDLNHDGRISYSEFIAYVRGGNAQEADMVAVNSIIDRVLTGEEEGHVPHDPTPAESTHRLRKRDQFLQIFNDMRAKFSMPLPLCTNDGDL
mmetsp:Transcript_18060/g.38565  ORF Transcript_18060/g.38565 Transcript_18060/m.38565 type:complete len:541 (+) Transcript_18060:97-1719(+)